MSLTFFQKNFIKKNCKNLSTEEMALELGIDTRKVRKYCIKHNLSRVKTEDKFLRADTLSFNFRRFIAENLWVFVGLFALVFIVYFNSLNNEFVSDDVTVILRNDNIKNINYIFESYTGFIQRFFIFSAHKLGGLNPAFYRTFNIIFHFLSTFILFIILNLLLRKRIAVFTSIIFAVHPILIESVTWISGMPYSLSTFFILLSFLFYILKKYQLSYVSLVFFFLALISLEKVMIFPAILLAFEFSREKLRENWKKLIPYFSLSTIWAILYISKISQRTEALQNQYYQEGGLENPLIQIPIAIVNYLKLIFWPKNLTLYHTDLTVSWGGYYLILFIFLVFDGLIIYSYKKNRQVFFWLSFFVISLLPTLTPLRISWVVAERYVYLGSIGIFVLVAMGIYWLSKKEKLKTYVYTSLAIIILALSIRTIIRNNDWQNEDTLWIATAQVSDAGPNIHNNLGDVYSRRGDFEKAAEEFKKAIEINPRFGDAYHNLALTYLNQGKTTEAEDNFRKALEINPRLWQSDQNLAKLYFDRGEFNLSLEHIKRAIEKNPNESVLKENLKIIENEISNSFDPKNQ